MKANVGMLYVVAAPINAYTPGSAPTYGTGFVVGEGREANVSWETASGEFIGDDIILDDYEEVIGYTMDMETAGLADATRVKLLGEIKDSSDVYTVGGGPKPWLGQGFVRKMRDDSTGTPTTVFEAVWYYRLRYSQPNEQTRTKERTGIEWRVPTMNAKGLGVFTSASAEYPDFEIHKDFTSLAAAKSYLNGLANISSTSTT